MKTKDKIGIIIGIIFLLVSPSAYAEEYSTRGLSYCPAAGISEPSESLMYITDKTISVCFLPSMSKKNKLEIIELKNYGVGKVTKNSIIYVGTDENDNLWLVGVPR